MINPPREVKRRGVPTVLVAIVAIVIGVTPPGLVGQDTVVVRVDNPPVWGDDVRLVEEVRIGTLEGDPNYALGPVGGIAATTDGTIWVGDQYLGAIRRFRSDGSYIDEVGRKGEGPGEFRNPGELTRLPDGRVAAWDSGLRRVTLFTESGSFQNSFVVSAPMISGGRLLPIFKSDTGGNLYVISSNFASLVRGRLAPTRSRQRWFWIKLRPDGHVLDSIPVVPGEQEGTVDPVRTNTVLSPLGYRITARTDSYELDLHVGDDRVIRFVRAYDPVAYQTAERREKNRLEEIFSGRNGRPAREIPPHKPVFSTLDVDDTGRIWIELYARGFVEPETPGEQALRERYDGVRREWRRPRVYDVIHPSGCYLGRVQFPNRDTTIEEARGNLVWVVEKGSFDEPYVVRYRIAPNPETTVSTPCRLDPEVGS